MTKTKKIRTIVADDISETLNLVCSIVEEVVPNVEIIGRYTSLAETQQGIDQMKPDVVILDIQFAAEEQTSFDLLERYELGDRPNFKLIIISGHSETEYYDMAFRYNAAHFIRKPVDKNMIAEAFRRISGNGANDRNPEMDDEPGYKKGKLIVNTSTSRYFVDPAKIVKISSANQRTTFHFLDGTEIESSRNIGYYEKMLASFDNLMRIHCSYIVNLDYVHSVSNLTERKVQLAAPFGEVMCSREKINALMKKIVKEEK